MDAEPQPNAVLAVDLDGTLVRSDVFAESILALVRQNPLYLFLLFRWWLSGRAVLKRRVAERVSIDPALLPYDASVLEYTRQEFESGRHTVLATGSDEKLATPVAEYLGCFSEVVASDGQVNCKGSNKRRLLMEKYGAAGYDYIGNSRADLPAWEGARGVMVASPSIAFRAMLRRRLEVSREFPQPAAGPATWLRALRAYQWLKNLLVFVPLFAAHLYADPSKVAHALTAFVAYCACASSLYLVNDLLDLPHDRRHPRKRARPLASGDLPIAAALVAAGLLLAGAFVLASLLPARFAQILALYLAFTLAYSAALKRIPVVDVMVLAGLYTFRILAGTAAIGVALSFWLLAFSMFLFLSLALLKRYSELREMEHLESVGAGRGYDFSDTPLVIGLGAGSAYSAVLVLALYINSDVVRQHYSGLLYLWLFCPVILFWVTHMWFSASRGRVVDDPIVFAVRDRVSLFCAAALALLFVLAR